MSRILVVDAAPLIYAVFNSVGHLATRSGEPTGLRYGFIRAVRSYQEKTKTDKTVIAFDSPGPVTKAKDLPNYKSNRVLTDAKREMYRQVPDLQLMLLLTKWTQVEAPGYEADDLIGAVARAKSQRGDEVVIVSPDNDLMQLVDDRTTIFRPGSTKKKTKDRRISDTDVFATYGVHPEYLCLYRAITGDPSDNLLGIVTTSEAKHQLQNLFYGMGRRRNPITPDEFIPALTKVPASSALHLLADSHRSLMEAHFKAMSLPTPPEIRVHKGLKDRAGLTALFDRLEFNSMKKFVGELTDTQEPAELLTV